MSKWKHRIEEMGDHCRSLGNGVEALLIGCCCMTNAKDSVVLGEIRDQFAHGTNLWSCCDLLDPWWKYFGSIGRVCILRRPGIKILLSIHVFHIGHRMGHPQNITVMDSIFGRAQKGSLDMCS